VTAGFTSAAAVTIASSQVKDLLGIRVPKGHGSKIPGLVGTWTDVVNNIGTTRYQDAILGIVCCVVLLLMRVSKYKQVQLGSASPVNAQSF
jgi:sodium-independent sulfate anion transporter 11